jgi:hypothetical protein
MFLLAAGSASAAVVTFENNQAGWNAAVTTTTNTINWDDVALADGTSTTILSTHYSGLPGSPTLAVDASSTLSVLDPSPSYFGTDFFPVSGENVFAPDDDPPPFSPEGILTISWTTPAYALGAWFLDVEGDFASTGIEVGGTLYAFSANQGDNSQRFLGIVSTIPFTSALIHMSSAANGNGVGIDDTTYALLPIPGAVLIGMLGLGIAGLKLRKFV